MKPCATLAAAALLCCAAPAQAQQGMVVLPGTMMLGETTQPARFAFGCTGNAPGATGTLAVELHVPGHDALRPRFDFDAYEGPDASAGQQARLGPTREAAAASQPLAVAGWIGVDGAFAFGLSAGIRGDAARLRAVSDRIAPFLDQGRLVWIQGNRMRGGAPILAMLEADAGAVARVRERVAPCLAAARR